MFSAIEGGGLYQHPRESQILRCIVRVYAVRTYRSSYQLIFINNTLILNTLFHF